MSSREENEGVVLRVVDAYNRTDFDGMAALLDEEVEAEQPGSWVSVALGFATSCASAEAVL